MTSDHSFLMTQFPSAGHPLPFHVGEDGKDGIQEPGDLPDHRGTYTPLIYSNICRLWWHFEGTFTLMVCWVWTLLGSFLRTILIPLTSNPHWHRMQMFSLLTQNTDVLSLYHFLGSHWLTIRVSACIFPCPLFLYALQNIRSTRAQKVLCAFIMGL